ncbi:MULTISPECIES: type II toxin-antitoxin system death-on-curing family toxin [Dermacoccus]|nr:MULTISPECIES: type II toxin-antitoxin system death-on-curing family toxin [Dermacoccus]
MSGFRFLSMDDFLAASEVALEAVPQIRDWGLVDSALNRPRAIVFGEDVYPGLFSKAAALLHSLVTNHALVDGNKRSSLGAVWLFLAFNGQHLQGTDDDRYRLILDVAEGHLRELADIAERLQGLCSPLNE